MKVRELNALLNKLTKADQDKEVTIVYPSIAGPEWDQPAVFSAKDGFYIVPRKIEDSLEENMTKEQIAAETTRAHQAALAAQQGTRS